MHFAEYAVRLSLKYWADAAGYPRHATATLLYNLNKLGRCSSATCFTGVSDLTIRVDTAR